MYFSKDQKVIKRVVMGLRDYDLVANESSLRNANMKIACMHKILTLYGEEGLLAFYSAKHVTPLCSVVHSTVPMTSVGPDS